MIGHYTTGAKISFVCSGGNHFSFFNFLEGWMERKEGREVHQQRRKKNLLLIWSLTDRAQEDAAIDLASIILYRWRVPL
jgi:hypothetical protein